MSLRELLSDDAAARAEYDAAIQAATEKGASDERKRVTAHIANIDHSKDVVVKAITEGTPFDTVAMSAYMNSNLKHQQGQQRSADNPGAIATDDNGADAGADAGAGKESPLAAAMGKGLDDMAAKESGSGFAY